MKKQSKNHKVPKSTRANKKGLNHQERSPKVVLVCVLKSKRDLDILTKEHWYRIPVSHAPVSHFDWLAFYQPRPFYPEDKRINYYTKVKSKKIYKRKQLLPEEEKHPRAKDMYIKINVGKIMRLRPPIKNIAPRRISFGFTTLSRLKNSKDILEIYDVIPIEEIIGGKLKDGGIQAMPQCVVSVKINSRTKPKRFRLDFAVYCNNGKIAIECDNQKSHSTPAQKSKDKEKDTLLKKDGWKVLRIQEKEVIENVEAPIKRVKKMIQKLGGQPH